MKFLFDFFPVILFFVAFKVSDIFVATGVAIAAAIVQIGYVLARRQKVSGAQWTGLALIVGLGGLTLWLRDETFIKWKPTVLYAIFGLSLLASLAFKRNLLKTMLASNLELPEPVWRKLCVAWGLFFLFKSALNLWVAYTFSTDTWVTFKFVGGIGLMIAAFIATGLYIARYLPDDPAPPVEKAP